ncbi:MAG: aminotransferase class I/II-fold pyridoxal phosphate-dependent enzyme [Rhodovarius sp.]|nr:aminotransferase class I/II-fold pyridoxal phosphate-dependent enzyme [Rhodovarius sp.]MDW8313375.1 aminotransferase class I/II-fold pyridoxal phosphate-dependent enzyme [Rhodovarius sp.]
MSQLRGLTANLRAAIVARLAEREGARSRTTTPGRDFATLPLVREMEMVRAGAEEMGIPNPFFRPHDGVAGGHSRIAGREVINFSSYNYLGLNGDPRVAEAAKQAIDRYGISASASRIASGERPVHAALERALAEHYQTEAALCFVSGHATNVTVIGCLMGSRDLIVADALSHNSAAEGMRLSGARRISFAHNDWREAERELAAHRRRYGRCLIYIEGHYSMDGDMPDLAQFVRLAREYDAWLMVDEAHSLGVLGATGRGVFEQQGVDPAGVDIWMGTLSKTLSACGGYIAGNATLIEMLKHYAPGFVYSVGMAPSLAAAALRSLEILHEEPWRVQRLQANARLFLEGARARGFDCGHSCGLGIVPVILGRSSRAGQVAAKLFEKGVNVQPILYPIVPEGSARLRFFISSEHSEEDITTALEALSAACA